MSRVSRPMVSASLLAALAFYALLLPAAPASAGCIWDYADCLDLASEESTFVRRSVRGADCYIDFVHCILAK